MRLIDRIGHRYSRLLVIERAPNRGGGDTNARWLCRCDCGRAVVAYGQDLARGKVKSCGCMNAERIMRHGMARTVSYRAWQQMLQRCENPNNVRFGRYGGRGIKVCERWRDYPAFLADMGDRPKGYTIERINNDGDYEPGNCRWATIQEQADNTSRTVRLTYNGKTMNVTQWAAETGIPRPTIYTRLRNGWSAEQILSQPIAARKRKED